MPLRTFTKTKIVATVGPSSQSTEALRGIINAGVDVIRLNMGHMDHKTASDVIARVRRLSSRAAILVDLQGPKIRLTDVATPFTLTSGQHIHVRAGQETSTPERLYVPFEQLLATIEVGHRVLINDGLVRLCIVERLSEHELLAEVVAGGEVASRKGVVAPDTRLIPASYLDDDDRADCEFARRKGVDFVAASFVSRASDVADVREAVGNSTTIKVISKIESRVGVENFSEILTATDGVMVARGDLGVELPPEEVPLIQKRLIKMCNAVAKPVVVATQMLESMVHAPVASRAETSDVANAILDGTDAVMLSAETSVGRFPIQAVQTLARISNFVEREATLFREDLYHRPSSNKVEFVCKAAARAAEELSLNAIVSLTSSGFTARNMSAYRPRPIILATTPDAHVIRQLALQYGVFCIEGEHIGRYDVSVYKSLEALVARGLLAEDHRIAIIGGFPTGQPGSTNMLLIGTVAELMQVED